MWDLDAALVASSAPGRVKLGHMAARQVSGELSVGRRQSPVHGEGGVDQVASIDPWRSALVLTRRRSPLATPSGREMRGVRAGQFASCSETSSNSKKG